MRYWWPSSEAFGLGWMDLMGLGWIEVLMRYWFGCRNTGLLTATLFSFGFVLPARLPLELGRGVGGFFFVPKVAPLTASSSLVSTLYKTMSVYHRVSACSFTVNLPLFYVNFMYFLWKFPADRMTIEAPLRHQHRARCCQECFVEDFVATSEQWTKFDGMEAQCLPGHCTLSRFFLKKFI